MAATNIARYGVKSPSQNLEIRAKQVATLAANPNAHKYNYTSLAEKDIKEWILEECGLTFDSEWELLDGQQVDLFNEELKLGIEYCGLYWHNESKNKGRLYHYNKYKTLQDKDIRLLTIFSDEWKYRNSQVKNFLKGTLGKNKYRIQARECEVKEVDAKIAEDFVEKHHIQGSHRASLISFGLFTGYGLVGVMSFNHHHRQNHDGSLILNRMCFADDTTVIGGASRMLKKGKEWAKEHGYKNIISWSDNRWSIGGIYGVMGFELDGELGPDYSYVNDSNAKVRIPKQKMMKKKIGCPVEIKEHDFLAKEGYYRIWDCGKKRWKIDLEK